MEAVERGHAWQPRQPRETRNPSFLFRQGELIAALRADDPDPYKRRLVCRSLTSRFR